MCRIRIILYRNSICKLNIQCYLVVEIGIIYDGNVINATLSYGRSCLCLKASVITPHSGSGKTETNRLLESVLFRRLCENAKITYNKKITRYYIPNNGKKS